MHAGSIPTSLYSELSAGKDGVSVGCLFFFCFVLFLFFYFIFFFFFFVVVVFLFSVCLNIYRLYDNHTVITMASLPFMPRYSEYYRKKGNIPST